MLKFVNHVAYVVQDRDVMVEYLEKTFGLKPQKVFVTANGKLKKAVYDIGKTQIQIGEPTDPSSTQGRFLAKHGPGVYHVAWEVDNIRKIAQELSANGQQKKGDGVEGLNETSGSYLTCNIDPAHSHGVWFQLTGPT